MTLQKVLLGMPLMTILAKALALNSLLGLLDWVVVEVGILFVEGHLKAVALDHEIALQWVVMHKQNLLLEVQEGDTANHLLY